MATTAWKAAVFTLMPTPLKVKKAAMMQIFTGQAGGHMSRLITHVGEVLGVSSLPMTYQGRRQKAQLED